MIFDEEKEKCSVDEAFDYVIVGSGAAGATAARVLVDTGASVAVVEEGPTVNQTEFRDRYFPNGSLLFRGGGLGALMARGRTFIPILQGSCLGGSTVINAAIVHRMPGDVWDSWDSDYGLGRALPLTELHRNWDQIEGELDIQPTPTAIWGENNRLMDSARQKLALSGGPTHRNVHDCRGSARCFTGCPFAAKRSMLTTYLPYAKRLGAILFTSARVDRVILQGNRAVGVRGYFHVPALKKNIAAFSLQARKAVIIAASAIQTPGVLRRSGVRSKHLGAHFQAHPGASLIGVFDQPVNMWFGATQGYEVDQHLADRGFKVDTISFPPELLFMRLPGVGRKWLQYMAEAPHFASWDVVLRAEAQGSVRENLLGTDIQYNLTPSDMVHLRQGLRFTAELFFAAGARAVITGVHGLPERLDHAEEAKLLEQGPDDPGAYQIITTHLFGTARMSVHKNNGVVGTDFAVHDTQNLYVVDSSVFPTNIGVNPQHSIMAIAMHAAHQIAVRNESAATLVERKLCWMEKRSGTTASQYHELAHLSNRELEGVFCAAVGPTPDALAGYEWRGYNMSAFTALLGIQKFIKGFFTLDDRIEGYNVAVQQNGLNAPWVPKLRPEKQKRYAFYDVMHVDVFSKDNLYPQALFLNYGVSLRNPRFAPERLLRDYLVQPDSQNPDLMLGKAYLAFGPWRLFSNFFIIQRMAPANWLP